MVGFNSTIPNTHPAFKHTNQPNPAELSIPPPQDLSLPFLEPLPDFDFIDDWIVDNDLLEMSVEGNAFVAEPEKTRTDFEDFIDSVELPKQDISGVFDEKLVKEERVSEESGLGSLIEQEMGKVSLVEASETSNLADQNQQTHDSSSKDNGVEANEVPLVAVKEEEAPFTYEVLGELKADENVHTGNELPFDGEVENRGVLSKENEAKDIPVDNNVKSSDEESSGSSDSESESESGSSSSSSSSSSEEDDDKEVVDDAEIEEGEIKDFDPEEILLGSDEDEPAIKGPIKSKNEIEFLPPVPPVNVTLEPQHKPLPVGKILSMMDTKVVVEGSEKHNPLNEGSILWITESRSPLGLVDEIFGPVKNPYYIVRYNSAEDVPAGICVGTPVSFVADFADHVLNDKNLYKKGYDASGENDEEISEEVEFSDDEKEAEYRRAQKMANKGANDKKRGNQEFGARKKNQKGPWKKSEITQNLVPTSGVWANGMTGQMQPNMVFPNGFLINGMPAQQLNQYQQPAQQLNQFQQPPQQLNQFQQPPQQLNQYQQPPQQLNQFQQPPQQLNQYQQPPQQLNGYPSGMPFQQFDPSQMFMHNMALPYGQPNFSLGPSTSWPGNLGQPGFNQVQFGMGVQGHQFQPPVNAGQSQDMASGSYNAQGHGIPSPSPMQGNFPAHHQHDQGRGSSRGGGRGRGRISSGRGRQ